MGAPGSRTLPPSWLILMSSPKHLGPSLVFSLCLTLCIYVRIRRVHNASKLAASLANIHVLGRDVKQPQNLVIQSRWEMNNPGFGESGIEPYLRSKSEREAAAEPGHTVKVGDAFRLQDLGVCC